MQHQPRKYGVTKYGFDRFLKGYLDMLTISFITRFGKSPMHLFGTFGTLMFITGFRHGCLSRYTKAGVCIPWT
ncbi:MAG: hypothetical protein MZU84_00650 [Sphingobacterium sp.]|nr:hypothetical protein [Sphingobacterium sp.]